VRDIDSEKCGQIGHARGLLHVVGDELEFGLALLHEFLNAPYRDRVEPER
jgi:hypothetical protein